MIINGANQYPGAIAIEENGKKKLLEKSTLNQRKILAETLL